MADDPWFYLKDAVHILRSNGTTEHADACERAYADLTAKRWPDLQCLYTRAVHELACSRCLNNKNGVMTVEGRDECPECNGNMRNTCTIELLSSLVSHVERLQKAQSNG